MTTRLILLRHGQSTSNVLGVATSALDGYPLTDLGRHQATAAGEALVESDASQVYSSPVLRARQTAAIVAKRSQLPVTVVDGLEEVHVGVYEGRAGDEIVTQGVANWREWLALGNPDHGFEGGETAGTAANRVSAALIGLVQRHGEGTAVVVSHGAALAIGLMRLCDNLSGAFLYEHLLDNCARVEVLVEPVGWRCVDWAGVRLEVCASDPVR